MNIIIEYNHEFMERIDNINPIDVDKYIELIDNVGYKDKNGFLYNTSGEGCEIRYGNIMYINLKKITKGE